MAKFKEPTAIEFAAKTSKKPARMVAEKAQYEARRKEISILLSNGTRASFSINLIPELANATPQDLRNIRIEGRGYGLYVPALDADISVAHLMADHLGSNVMLKILNRRTASRLNGKLGGRPAKTHAA